jgi:hypothetical protein
MVLVLILLWLLNVQILNQVIAQILNNIPCLNLFIINFILLRLITEFGCEVDEEGLCEDLISDPCINNFDDKNCFNGVNINRATQKCSNITQESACHSRLLLNFPYLYFFFIFFF